MDPSGRGSNVSTEDNDSEDDSDIEVGGKTQDYKCPLTLSVMENPVTSYVALDVFLSCFLIAVYSALFVDIRFLWKVLEITWETVVKEPHVQQLAVNRLV